MPMPISADEFETRKRLEAFAESVSVLAVEMKVPEWYFWAGYVIGSDPVIRSLAGHSPTPVATGIHDMVNMTIESAGAKPKGESNER